MLAFLGGVLWGGQVRPEALGNAIFLLYFSPPIFLKPDFIFLGFLKNKLRLIKNEIYSQVYADAV